MVALNVLNTLYVVCVLWTIQACYGDSSEQEIDYLRDQLELLMDKVKMVVKENANHRNEFAKVQINFKRVVKENADIRNEFADVQNNFKRVVQENAELRHRVVALEHRKSDHLAGKEKRQSTGQWVAFSAYLDHPMAGLGMGQILAYNRVLTNEGNGYNSASGIFVAPVSGIYLFSWASTARRLSGGSAYDEWVDLVVDGVHMLTTVAESREAADDNQGSSTAVVRLNKGQQVWTAQWSDQRKIHGNDNERSTSFTGVLIHEYE